MITVLFIKAFGKIVKLLLCFQMYVVYYIVLQYSL